MERCLFYVRMASLSMEVQDWINTSNKNAEITWPLGYQDNVLTRISTVPSLCFATIAQTVHELQLHRQGFCLLELYVNPDDITRVLTFDMSP